MRGELTFQRPPYLPSSLVCRSCGAPMSWWAGSSTGTTVATRTRPRTSACAETATVRQDVMRPQILDTIRERLLAPEGVACVRKRSAQELYDQSKKIDAELRRAQRATQAD